MTLSELDIGRRVRYHGPGEPNCPHDWHYRVSQVLPHGSVWERRTFIGQWAVLDDGCGSLVTIPQALLSPVVEDCWCDACC